MDGEDGEDGGDGGDGGNGEDGGEGEDNQNPQQPHARRPGLAPEFQRAVARKHILDARPGGANLNKNNREPRAVRQARGGAWTTKPTTAPRQTAPPRT